MGKNDVSLLKASLAFEAVSQSQMRVLLLIRLNLQMFMYALCINIYCIFCIIYYVLCVMYYVQSIFVSTCWYV